jgi:1,4-dihydroxy-2-naphthoate octaprenyltransferase
MNQQDTLTSAAAAKATYAASAVTVIAGMTVGEWAALIGIGATLATFVANLWFKIRQDIREEREHELRMEEYKAGLNEE